MQWEVNESLRTSQASKQCTQGLVEIVKSLQECAKAESSRRHLEAEKSKREAKRLGNALANVRAEARQLRAVVMELQRDLDDERSQRSSHCKSSQTGHGISEGLNDDQRDVGVSERENFDDANDEDDAVEHSSAGAIGSSTLCDASMIARGAWGRDPSYDGVGLASVLCNKAKDVGETDKCGKEFCSGDHSCIGHNYGAPVSKTNTENNRSAVYVGVVARFFVAASDSDLYKWRGISKHTAAQVQMNHFT